MCPVCKTSYHVIMKNKVLFDLINEKQLTCRKCLEPLDIEKEVVSIKAIFSCGLYCENCI